MAAPAPAPPVLVPRPETVIIKAVTYAPWERAIFWGYRELIIRFNERAKGEAFIQYIGGGEVIPSFPQGKAVHDGSIDMSNVFASAYGMFVPAANTVAFSKLTPLEERESGYHDYLAERFRDEGMFFLGRPIAHIPFYIFTNVKPERYQDMAGLKISTDSPTWKSAFDAWDIVSVAVPDGELYTAIDSGLVDGDIEPAATVLDFSLYEVLDYIIGYPLGLSSLLVVINLEAWNRLSPEMQDLMIEIQLEMEAEIAPYFEDYNATVIQQLVEKGMELITFSEADGKAYVDSFYPNMWESVREQLSPEDFLKLKEITGN